jgi:hypothetical protein
MDASTKSNIVQLSSGLALRFAYLFVFFSGFFPVATMNGGCPRGTAEVGRTETAEQISVTCVRIEELTWAQIQAINPKVIEGLGREDRQQLEKRKSALQSDSVLRARVSVLDAQIAETEKQLRGLGFKKAVPDFAWFAGQSGRAQQQMIGELVSDLREYTIGKTEAEIQNHFLNYIDTMSNRDVSRLADQLARLGLRNDTFQAWLRAYSRKASREVLLEGARLTIDAIHRQDDLFKIHDGMEKGTIEDQQLAALTLLSMLVDHPALKELKSVAAGIYAVGEAWATIIILDQGIDQLTTATETQLANQKGVILHMQALVDERNRTREKLAKLP